MSVEDKFEELLRNGHINYYHSDSFYRYWPRAQANVEIRYCPTLLLKKPGDESGPGRRNPFLPPDPALVLTSLGKQHTLIFNKYCVMRNHLLIISNEFVSQERPLERTDFEACGLALSYLQKEGREAHVTGVTTDDWMFFYNSGPESGASQPHRHLQLIPRADPPLIRSSYQNVPAFTGKLHFFKASDHLNWHDTYVRALEYAVPLQERASNPNSFDAEGSCSLSYSLCFTRHWMLLVPREHERVEGISFNALAIVGYLLAMTPDQLTLLRDTIDLNYLFSALTHKE